MTTQNQSIMRKLKWMKPTLFAFGFVAVLSSCETGGSNSNTQAVKPNLDSLELAKQEELKKIFFSIPAPMEMAALIKDAGFKFDPAALNNVENASKYTGEVKQAVNLGVYGADLSYSSMFDEKQKSVDYLAAAQKLARQMGVDDALKNDMLERLQTNQDSRDSLLAIVSEAYTDLNGYLKENNRVEISALVISGGWIEALYLSTKYSAGNDQIKKRIAEQKYSLDELLKYFDKFGEIESLKEMKADLISLQKLYGEATTTAPGATTTSKDAKGTVVIGNSASVSLSDETLKKIETLVTQIRSKYIA
jgi:DNA-directed RNA polymerase subunit F